MKAANLYDLKFLSEPHFSPEGEKAIFTVTRADEQSNGYLSSFWLLENEKLLQITKEGKNNKAFFEDDTHLLFASKSRGESTAKETAFYRINLLGAEAQFAFKIPEKVATIKPFCNGLYAISTRISLAEKKDEREFHAQIGEDFEVFDELPFWVNAEGITNKTRDIFQIYNPKDGTLFTLCDREFKGSSFCVNKEKALVAFSGCMLDKGVYNRQSGLWLYDYNKKETKELISQGNFLLSNLCFWDNELFFTKNDLRFPGCNPKFCRISLDNNAVYEFDFADIEIGKGLTTDVSYGEGIVLKADKEFLYFISTKRDKTVLIKMDKNGKMDCFEYSNCSFCSFDQKGNKAIFVGFCDGKPQEIFSLNLDTKEIKKLSSFNEEFTKKIAKVERFIFENRAGLDLDGYLLYPANYEKGKKYPGILEIHGGPKGIYSDIFHLEMQILSANGFFVFFTNPRGGDGRGEDFANITGKLGTIDYEDLMDFTDEVLKRYPDIDEKNLACCGGSYGGFMVNWMVGHTERFKAACSQRSISNYLSKPYTTDIGYYHNIAQLTVSPLDDFEKVWANSPLKYAPFAKAATLFIQSDEDYRCWQSDALQMFMAMRSRGVDCRMVLFKGENHGLSRAGKPQNRISRLNEITNWFIEKLK